MITLNIEFQEKYKKLDKLLKDMLKSDTGVSEYIRAMENTSVEWRINVRTWDNVYKQLKRARWIRNKLAHEVPLDCDICSYDDLFNLDEFYSSLINQSDPLTLARKEKNYRRAQYSITEKANNSQQSPQPKKKSIWERIKTRVKNLFFK